MTDLTDELATDAEKRAERAENLDAFRGFKLAHVKRQLTKMLALIGRDLMFNEFTRHDITHINKMLRMVEWIIPDAVKSHMSPADWLLLTLSIYFHDFGMLISTNEFESRDQSMFPAFKAEAMAGPYGKDLVERFSSVPNGMDRFLYQEFVRRHHAARIRLWLTGNPDPALGVANVLRDELNDLFSKVTYPFRRDLSLVCESHHLEDLGDVAKYKLSEPYGDSPEETANVQYCAVILRTVDLLHITSDRTPSIEYKIISPHDPISQVEWGKQMAVRSVRARMGIGDEGNPDPDVEKDTIEVHAYFNEPDPFFVLTSYLAYARDELVRSNKWISTSEKIGATNFKFPWRHIDDSGIETAGFLPSKYEFSLDQARILDLLTGHTIYNDTGVVLRELVQNSLDAVRVQRLVSERRKEPYIGAIQVSWDPDTRTLEVRDDGTGMTRATIEQHLLRAGSSKYQDPEFRKDYPAFSPISRFGIGILSCFMIADEVDIVTGSSDDNVSHQLALRSLHGKYLIRQVDKRQANILNGTHGTTVRLKVRRGADNYDPLLALRRWIVLPACDITFVSKSGPPVPVGFKTLTEALAADMDEQGIKVDGEKIKIDELTVDGVSVALAVQWSEYFQEWSVLRLGGAARERERLPPLGTCVEGIRVENGTPGYRDVPFYAIANATGPQSPKTNVARSELETTPELVVTLGKIYGLYCKHVTREVDMIQSERGFSITWAAHEANFLVAPILEGDNGRRRIQFPAELHRALRSVPALILEQGGERRLVPADEILGLTTFWTVECAFFRSAEDLLKEVPGSTSLTTLINGVRSSSFVLPDGPVICNYGTLTSDGIRDIVSHGREVDSISIHRKERRIDLAWKKTAGASRWISFPGGLDVSRMMDYQRRRYGVRGPSEYEVGTAAVPISGSNGETAFRAFGVTYVRHETPVAGYLARLIRDSNRQATLPRIEMLISVLGLFDGLWGRGKLSALETDEIRRYLASRPDDFHAIDTGELVDVVRETNWSIFDTWAWRRAGREVDI